MSQPRILGEPLPNLFWQVKPQGYPDVVWRHTANPINPWNPTPRTARIFNSAVIPYGDGFVGVFRAEHKHGKALLHVGWSQDGLSWDIQDEQIHWVDEADLPYLQFYAYDPRPVKLGDAYYICSTVPP